MSATKAEAQAALRAAMARHGVTESDLTHQGAACWCGPEILCGRCGKGACSCGVALVVVHRRAT